MIIKKIFSNDRTLDLQFFILYEIIKTRSFDTVMVTNLSIMVLILAIIAFFSTTIGSSIIDYFNFYSEGKKNNFSNAQLQSLWKALKDSHIKEKSRIFLSNKTLQEATAILINKSNLLVDTTEKKLLNELVTKLYDIRTTIELEKGKIESILKSTNEITVGQICVLVFINVGQFYANLIENNQSGLKFRSIGELPKTYNFKNADDVTVYLWKKNDAGYVFKTTITNIERTNAGTVFFAKHSKKIIRTQKRKSIRAESDFDALLFLQHPQTPANIIPESINGVKCKIKDISEDGALVFVKGRAVKGLKAKLQFELETQKIVMFVKSTSFIYSTSQHISKIHFFCEKISEENRNAVLSYVYKTKSQD